MSGNLKDPGTFEIFVMNADGTNRTQLTNDVLVDVDFSGNFIQAEMVKAFITSDEYRHRFGP